MIVSDIADTLGASLIASTLGQSERSRSSRAGASDAVSPTSERAGPRVEQQSSSTQVSLSASGQLRSSVAQLQESSAALADDTNTPEERSAAARNFVNAYNNAQAAAHSVMSEDEGTIAEDDRAAIAKAFAATDASAFRERSLGSLSGGERMRVLLARALAVEAEMLLADEPLAGLDPRHQFEAMVLFRRIAAAGTGVVVVLHDLALAGRFCDRLVLLESGRILADGPPATVLDDGNLARAFGIAVARGSRDGEHFILPWQALDPGEPRR